MQTEPVTVKIKRMDIIMTKWAGAYATSLLVNENETKLSTRFPAWLLEDAKELMRCESVEKEEILAKEHRAVFTFAVGENGILGGLWDFAEALHSGLEVDLRRIPIRQETVEITEFLELNPYEMDGTGSLLIAAEDSVNLLIRLSKNEIPAQSIGKLTEGNDRILLNEGRKGYLNKPR